MLDSKSEVSPPTQYPAHRSARLRSYDYAFPGAYFVTVCTHERNPSVGHIGDGNMEPNAIGKIADTRWADIKVHFPNTELPAYVVMPNHVHGIIMLQEAVGTRHAVSASAHETFGRPVAGSLPTIIRSFKSAVTKQVNVTRGENPIVIWQKGYYEHVIRTDHELVQIGDYILNNPAQWQWDRENSGGTKGRKPLPFEY